MTLVIGIKCTDGIVMGADGAATLGVMGDRTIQQPIKKLEILSKSLVLGFSGSIGLGQRIQGEIKELWDNKGLSNKKIHEAMNELRKKLWKHISIEYEIAVTAIKSIDPVGLQDALCHTILAGRISKELRLFQFDQQGAPEEATEHLPFISIGSGQRIADPFLAFLRSVFWPKKLPSLKEGIFATVWTLKHAIKTNPGGVSDPKQIVTLQCRGTDVEINELPEDELEGHIESSHAAERYLSEFPKTLTEKDEKIEIPQPKKNNKSS